MQWCKKLEEVSAIGAITCVVRGYDSAAQTIHPHSIPDGYQGGGFEADIEGRIRSGRRPRTISTYLLIVILKTGQSNVNLSTFAVLGSNTSL